ncbi:Gfo/Idh/MocA family oxidoreductase [Pseudoalteromonas sp. OF7H-1]|uniref:Gfo/Idh/MocA family protein n=1 Tax=Pseudoalteromonas TaxID=53246 RepID=UPI001EF620D8|nr:Gfo/Idh/MocA family oxidoreductase [Pseudoalteromonas sp. OF7H-1]MCG7540575.1 Gfo/Idh/MocA family oxidoreductase [Pseudoalteromonas sp. OF7H-1]
MDNNKIRMAMIGGGEGAFIGAVHRIAARLDGQIELVAGAFSAQSNKSLAMGQQLGLNPARCYASYQTLLQQEAELPESERIHFVAIVTPNYLHFPIATAAIEHGFHVLSDKPATLNLSEALRLQTQLQKSNCLYGLTHTYTGYPMVKEARHRIANGELGKIRKVVVEYSQGWLASADDENSKQASWRLDASKSGVSCCMGDIGVHAANLAEYVSGLEIEALCADLNTVVSGRQLDDDGTVLLRFGNGAKGVLMASQIALGEENNLTLKIYGDKASIEWSQMEPNSLWLRAANAPAQLIRTGVGSLSQAAISATRVPAGHPEGYLEAFANIYLNFANLIRAHQQQANVQHEEFDVPSINAAVRGMAFIENAVAASAKDTKWHPFTIG